MTKAGARTCVFGQVVLAKPVDTDAVRHAIHRWNTELGPTAEGLLGSSAGITERGAFVWFTRFGASEQARASSERPEQRQWWSQLQSAVTDIEIIETNNTYIVFGSDFENADVVQGFRMKIHDHEGHARALEHANDFGDLMYGWPGMLGEIVVAFGDSEEIAFIYFDDDANFREDWREHMSPAFTALWHSLMNFASIHPEFYTMKSHATIGAASR